MSFLPSTPEDEADGTLAEAYARVRDARGHVANLWKAQGHHPDALRAHLDLYTALMHQEGALGRRERELIGLVVSHANRSPYGQAHHADAFSRYSHEPGLVGLLAADPARAPLKGRERAIADYATKLTNTPSAVDDKDVEQLREAGLEDTEIAEVALIAAYVNFANRVAAGLGVSHEDVAGDYKY